LIYGGSDNILADMLTPLVSAAGNILAKLEDIFEEAL